MKKLTAGIFTVLMGLVSVNAADAAVASKGYVDKEIRTLDAAYKAADKDLSDRIDDLTGGGATKEELNAAIAAEVTRSNKYADDAVAAEVTRADLAYDVKGAAATAQSAAEATAKSYTDTEIAKINSDENGILKQAKDYAEGKVHELATGSVKANTDAIAAIHDVDTGILKQAKDYTDGKTGDVDFTSEGLNVVKGAANLTAAVDLLDAEASGNRSRITTLMGNEQVEGSVKKQIKDASDATKVAYEAADAAALVTAQGYADAAESAAKTYAKTYTDQKVAGLNLAEISRVPAACGTPGNYCTLTTNGTNFVWEVIARGDAADEEAPSAEAGSSRLQVTVPAVVNPTVTQ